MTATKSMTRKRRSGGAIAIPKGIAQWFAGEKSFTFFSGTPPHAYLLHDYWAAWLQANPGAEPPQGLANRIASLASAPAGSHLAGRIAAARKSRKVVTVPNGGDKP